MSLVGTRPILQDELRQYELHHRARIAIKPGITGMWQVSGRSDITDFEEVVRLDTEYIDCLNDMLDYWTELARQNGFSGMKYAYQNLTFDLIINYYCIPDNVVLHGLKQRNGKFIVRIFGVNDNPKENRLFGRDLDELEDTLGVRFWEENGQAHTLWSAALYQEADTIREATDAALELYEIVTGGKDFDRSLWTAVSHKSLCAGFNEADPDAIIAWNKRMADLVTMDGIAKAIRDQVPAGSIRKLQSLTKIQKEWLRKRLRKADFGEKMRLHYYLGVILEDENEVQECFRIIQSEVLEATIKSLAYNEQARIVTDRHTVRLPLRVNWGGGWSDTPPYCNEKGGTVLNAAILLNGEKPVKQYLDEHYQEKISLDFLAEHFFISKYYLTRVFREQFGVSISSYLMNRRVTKAKYMLRFSNEKIKTIGYKCGLGEPHYFSRVFRQMEGMSPLEYREKWEK